MKSHTIFRGRKSQLKNIQNARIEIKSEYENSIYSLKNTVQCIHTSFSNSYRTRESGRERCRIFKVLLPQFGNARPRSQEHKTKLKARQCGLFVANVTLNSITKHNDAIANCRFQYFYCVCLCAQSGVCDRKR